MRSFIGQRCTGDEERGMLACLCFPLLLALALAGCSDTVQENKPWEIEAKDSGVDRVDMSPDAKPTLDCAAYTFTEVDGYYFDHHKECGFKTCDDVCASIERSCVKRYDEQFVADIAGRVLLETNHPSNRYYIYHCYTPLESIYLFNKGEKLLGYSCFCE